jgi:glucokinase
MTAQIAAMLIDLPLDEHGLETAVVADVGRRAVRLALTDARGRLRPDTIRAYDPSQQSTISGALTAFCHESGLRALPRHCAIAVAGAPVGDTISITNSRWFVSRSGLTAMLQAPPLILNDFAANAWAFAAPGLGGRVESAAGPEASTTGSGVRCLIGVGSGLGVALVARDETGLRVVSTEAGHCHFPGGFEPLDPVLAQARQEHGYASAEDMLSARGLIRLYRTLAVIEGTTPRSDDALAIIHLALVGHDRLAMRACETFARALWYYAGNLALAHGAWDGVLLTGGIVHALRGPLRQISSTADFVLRGPFLRQLRDIPRAIVSLDHAELHGAAQALLRRDAMLGDPPAYRLAS